MAAKTWNNLAGDNKWSTGGNWTGGTVPATTDTITFDSTSTANCTIDNLGTWNGGTFTIASTYSGTITQNSGINITTAAFSQAAGTFTGHSAATFTSTTFSVTGGTFNQGGAFVSTTFGCTSTGTFVGGSATMSTTAVTFSNTATLTATSGIWSLAGSFTKSNSPTFTHNSGTINITAASTFNAASLTFNKINITTTNAAVTISASTTAPLGSAPTTTTGTAILTITGTITWSGLWTHTGSITTSNGSTLTGTSTPTIAINQSVTITATTTITNAIGTITANGSTQTTVTDTGNALSATTWVIAKTGNSFFVVAASTTVSIGSNPTVTAGQVSVTGTLSGTGTYTQTITSGTSTNGGLSLIPGTLLGFTTCTFTNLTFQCTSGATIPSGLNVNITLNASGVSQTFFGGTKTFGTVTVTLSSTFTLTIRDNNTFGTLIRAGAGVGFLSIGITGATSSNTITTFQDNDGLATHTTIIAGGAQTITNFTVAGAAGKIVTMRAAVPGTSWTMTSSGGQSVDYVLLQDSTVDASPVWNAGSHSMDGGGNTNWVFAAAGGTGISRSRIFARS